MRERVRALEKTWKFNRNHSNFNEKTEVRKRKPSETDVWRFVTHFGPIWELRKKPKMQKRGFRRVPKKGSNKKVSEPTGRKLKTCWKRQSVYQYIWLVLLHPSTHPSINSFIHPTIHPLSFSSHARIRVSSNEGDIAAACRSQGDPWCSTNIHSKSQKIQATLQNKSQKNEFKAIQISIQNRKKQHSKNINK